MSGLENPWDMAFLPNGAMLYTEKCKGLSVRTKSGKVVELAVKKAIHGENIENLQALSYPDSIKFFKK